MSMLLSPLTLKSRTLKNRVVVSPMCMYSSLDGYANDFHQAHLGALALGGAGLVLTEAAAVSPEARITPEDLGLWEDGQVPLLREIADFAHRQGALFGFQLAHAGRKASTYAPWRGKGEVQPDQGGWEVVGPSALAFSPSYPTPRAMTEADRAKVIQDFADATRRAAAVGTDVVEIHAAHGYLLHQYLSPLSNARTDEYGGSFENRARFPLEVVRAVREAWPEELPLLVRISASDWVPGGWDLDQSVELSKLLKNAGVDLIDVSSGGLSTEQKIELSPGYQVPLAARIKAEAEIPTMAVGLITQPQQAEAVVANGQADLVALARELLRDPNWPLRAARELGEALTAPKQYERAWL